MRHTHSDSFISYMGSSATCVAAALGRTSVAHLGGPKDVLFALRLLRTAKRKRKTLQYLKKKKPTRAYHTHDKMKMKGERGGLFFKEAPPPPAHGGRPPLKP